MRTVYRYRIRSGQHGHPRAQGPWRHVQEHILIAERAFGKYLPTGAEVHHVDGDGRNNTNSNLVICQSKAYHKLLHWRERIIRAGGDPNVGKFCSDCKQFKAFDAFNRSAACKHSGRANRCRPCSSESCKRWWRERGRRTAA